MSPRVTTFGNCIARWIPLGFGVADGLEQYVKQEVSGMGEHGREARATRLITERASTRIGKMACEIALQRPRKVRILVQHSSIRSTAFISLLVIILPVICVLLFPIPDSCFFFHSILTMRGSGDLPRAYLCFTIYPARHDHPQVKRLVCD